MNIEDRNGGYWITREDGTVFFQRKYPDSAAIDKLCIYEEIIIEMCKGSMELIRLFELQHTRTVAADRAWQKAHNKPDVWPDLGELIQWLMESPPLPTLD